MDYFNNVFTIFLDLKRSNDIAAYVWFRNLSDFMKNILICVPKMNEGITDLGWHEGEYFNTGCQTNFGEKEENLC